MEKTSPSYRSLAGKAKRTYASQVFPAMLVLFRSRRRELATARRAPVLLSYRLGDVARKYGDLSSLHPTNQPGQRTQRCRADRLRYALQLDEQS